MRKCILLLLASLLSVVALGGCQESTVLIQSEISDTLGLDVSAGKVIESSDTHGGFHGDGTTYIVLGFSDESVLDQIEGNSDWKPLPLSENLTALVYGIKTDTGSIGPYLNVEEAPIPDIQNGYYYFFDRHPESTDSLDDSDVLNRHSFNYTLAMYNADTGVLYFVECDT